MGFAAVIMRIREPKSTALIFGTGKVMVTGAKSEEKARKAARKYARILQKLDFPAQFRGFAIHNVVCSADLGFPVRLEGLARRFPTCSSYEPELFPGLIYRLQDPKITILVFVSGKIVLTGGKSRAQIDNAFGKMYPILVRFKKDQEEMEEEEDVDEDSDMDL